VFGSLKWFDLWVNSATTAQLCASKFFKAVGERLTSLNLFFILLFVSCGGWRRLTGRRRRLFREIEMVVTSRSRQIFRFRRSANLACSRGLLICTTTRSLPSILSAKNHACHSSTHEKTENIGRRAKFVTVLLNFWYSRPPWSLVYACKFERE